MSKGFDIHELISMRRCTEARVSNTQALLAHVFFSLFKPMTLYCKQNCTHHMYIWNCSQLVLLYSIMIVCIYNGIVFQDQMQWVRSLYPNLYGQLFLI
jgi:hypothetical protein